MALSDLSVWCLSSGESWLLLADARSLDSILYEDVNRAGNLTSEKRLEGL